MIHPYIEMILLNILIFSDIFKRDEDQSLLPNHHHSFDPINQKLPQLDPRFPSGMDQSVTSVTFSKIMSKIILVESQMILNK